MPLVKMRGWRKKIFVERRLYIFRKKKYERFLHRREKKKRGRLALSCLPKFGLSEHEKEWVSIVGSRGYVPPDEALRLKSGSLCIRLPEIFDFERNYHESATVVSIFRKALVCNKRISYIDFSHMKEISSSCIMVFACYADLWKRRCRMVHPRTETWQPGIASAFHQIGFFDILNLSDRNSWSPTESRMKHMGLECHYIEQNLDNVGRVIHEITENIENFVRCKLDRMSMYRSFTEAVTNVYHHAYPKRFCREFLERKWWLSVSFDEERKELHISVFDHGAGIPNTMASNIDFSRFKRLYYALASRRGQQERLFIAFEHRRTSKGRFRHATNGRGHGCSDILKYLSEGKGEGSLYVISDKAKYFYSTKDRAKRGAAESLPISINGTLIEWRICL